MIKLLMKHFNLSIIDAIRVQCYYEKGLAHKIDKIMRRYDNTMSVDLDKKVYYWESIDGFILTIR